jgi:hypothetical protein
MPWLRERKRGHKIRKPENEINNLILSFELVICLLFIMD